MIAAGVKAKVTCVDPSKVAESFAGREYDLSLLNALPGGADPCGENGEFRTFVYNAPVFSHPIEVLPTQRHKMAKDLWSRLCTRLPIKGRFQCVR